jgi:hypothetical protein
MRKKASVGYFEVISLNILVGTEKYHKIPQGTQLLGQRLIQISPKYEVGTGDLVDCVADVSGGAGLVSKVLLANADTLCAAASPLMDFDNMLL